MFGFRKKRPEPDEAQRFLESVKDEPEMPDPAAAEDKALEAINAEDSRAHYDIINLLVLAVVVIFFGAAFLALTNKQDFASENRLTAKSFFSGNYLARAEKEFNDSLPLKDYLHNAESYLKYCFGIGNKTDIIDITSKKNMDDPYSIENDIADNSPLNSTSTAAEPTESAAETQPPQEEEEDNITNRKISPIKLDPSSSSSSSSSDSSEEQTTTTNNDAPGATTTTTVPPETTTTTNAPDDNSQPETSATDGDDNSSSQAE